MQRNPDARACLHIRVLFLSIAVMQKQFLKFALVGATATLTTYAVLILLVEGPHLGAVPASVVGYLAGAGVNYVLNYRFTFSSSQLHQVAIPRYLAVMTVGLLLNAVIMYVAVSRLAIHYLIAQLVAVAIVLVWSFALNRRWAFAH
jgi:putative flippase GtrA